VLPRVSKTNVSVKVRRREREELENQNFGNKEEGKKNWVR
jgi:hypothetical protein